MHLQEITLFVVLPETVRSLSFTARISGMVCGPSGSHHLSVPGLKNFGQAHRFVLKSFRRFGLIFTDISSEYLTRDVTWLEHGGIT